MRNHWSFWSRQVPASCVLLSIKEEDVTFVGPKRAQEKIDRLVAAIKNDPALSDREGSMTFICKPCKEGDHNDCAAGTWCDCQHRD